MRSQEELNSLVTSLKMHIDCLLIRMESCEQSIERLFKIIFEASSNCNEKLSSIEDINYLYLDSPDRIRKDMPTDIMSRKGKKSLPDMLDIRIGEETLAPKRTESAKQPAIKDFLLMSSNKQISRKQGERGSFSIFKEAILGNMNEIQKISTDFQALQRSVDQKLSKSNSAIEILTRVTTLMQEKIQNFILTRRSKQKNRNNRDKSIGKYQYGYNRFQITKTPRDADSLGKYRPL